MNKPENANSKKIVPISRSLTLVFSALIIFTNIMLGILLYFQFERQITVAWTDRYHVPLDNLDREIEYGLQLGVSLRTMGNLPQMLKKTTERYPELSSLYVIDKNGKLLARTDTHTRKSESSTLVNLLHKLGKNEVNGKSITTKQNQHYLIWSVKNPFGDMAGFLALKLPWSELQRLQNLGRERLTYGISAIVLVFILLSFGLFRLICRSLETKLYDMDKCASHLLTNQSCHKSSKCTTNEDCALFELTKRIGTNNHTDQKKVPRDANLAGTLSHSRFRTRILSTSMVLLLASSVASTAMGYLIFRDIYLPVLYSQSRIIGESLGELISEMHSHGIPINKMTGMKQIFSDLLDGFPQIAALGLYNEQGKLLDELGRKDARTLPKETRVRGLDDPESVTMPILYDHELIGMVGLAKVPHFFAKRLLDITLNVVTLLVVSLLIASELLTFMVRFLVVVPFEGLLGELRGESTLAYVLPTTHDTSLIGRINNKCRSLLQDRPRDTSTQKSPGSSPLLAYIRPPLFLVVFADAMSLSFFPIYVESFRRSAAWIPPHILMALPISIFMFVWAISLPLAGQWSDKVGRRQSFIIGALITAIGLGLTATAQGIIQLIIFRSITALGYGVVYITAQSYVADHTTAQDRTQGMATFLGGFFSGSLCGAAIGGILADRVGYQTTFAVSAFMSILAALFVYRFILHTAPNTETSKPSAPPLHWRDFLNLFRDRCFIQITILTAIPAKILLTGFLYYSAPLYLHSIGASKSVTGQVIMLYGLTIVLLGPFAAKIADRWNMRRGFIGIGALGSAIALSIPFIHPGIIGLLMTILLIGLSHSIAVAPQLAVITGHIQNRPNSPGIGKVIGIFRLTERGGNILGPIIFGALLSLASPEKIFMDVGIYIAVSALLFITLLRYCKSPTN